MKKQHVIDHFGSQAETARKLGVSEALVSRWPDVMPFKWALQVEQITDNRLSVNLQDYRIVK